MQLAEVYLRTCPQNSVRARNSCRPPIYPFGSHLIILLGNLHDLVSRSDIDNGTKLESLPVVSLDTVLHH